MKCRPKHKYDTLDYKLHLAEAGNRKLHSPDSHSHRHRDSQSQSESQSKSASHSQNLSQFLMQ